MEKQQRRKFSPEIRERAVRLAIEHRGDHASQWAAIVSIAAKIGCTAQTLHNWVVQAEISDKAAPCPLDRVNRNPPWAASATATTMPWPKRSTVSTRPRSSTAAAHGVPWKPSSTPRSNGWTG